MSVGRFAASVPLAGLRPAPAADAAGRVKSRTKVLPSVAVPTGVSNGMPDSQLCCLAFLFFLERGMLECRS